MSEPQNPAPPPAADTTSSAEGQAAIARIRAMNLADARLAAAIDAAADDVAPETGQVHSDEDAFDLPRASDPKAPPRR